jgi:biopolymer transport protein ExbB
MIHPQTSAATAALPTVPLDTLYDIVVSGGILMWPIGFCSIVALTFIVERAIRLRERELGSKSYGRSILDALVAGGPPRAVEACKREARPLGRILCTGLERSERPMLEREKAVEDAGARELARLNSHLRPLAIVAVLAPLLGFLGTVFGMIQAFITIALKEGLGRPELLAAGISQALVTTAAGLCVAIPAQAAYFWFRGRVERFGRRVEDLYLELDEALAKRGTPALALASSGATP